MTGPSILSALEKPNTYAQIFKDRFAISFMNRTYVVPPVKLGENLQVIDGAVNFERTGTDLYGSLWLYTSPYKELEIFAQLGGRDQI